MPDAAGTATLVQVQKYFGYTNLAAFRKDWQLLSDDDKKVLRAGLGNGTLNY